MKSNTAKSQKPVDAAKAAEKAAKAKKAAESRVVRAISAIDAVSKLKNHKFNPAQIEAIQKALTAQIELTMNKLNGKIKVESFTLPA